MRASQFIERHPDAMAYFADGPDGYDQVAWIVIEHA